MRCGRSFAISGGSVRAKCLLARFVFINVLLYKNNKYKQQKFFDNFSIFCELAYDVRPL